MSERATPEEAEYVRWVDRCHRPLTEHDRAQWRKFYASWFRRDHEGRSWRDRELDGLRRAD